MLNSIQMLNSGVYNISGSKRGHLALLSKMMTAVVEETRLWVRSHSSMHSWFIYLHVFGNYSYIAVTFTLLSVYQICRILLVCKYYSTRAMQLSCRSPHLRTARLTAVNLLRPFAWLQALALRPSRQVILPLMLLPTKVSLLSLSYTTLCYCWTLVPTAFLETDQIILHNSPRSWPV